MINENRITELISQMHSFEKQGYLKKELLSEYLELQKELINLTFNDVHAEKSNLRLWDVENHLDKLNEECGFPANEEIARFKEGCKIVSNAIKSEFSGNAGEYKAFRSLETLRCPKKLLKNIELSTEDRRTEIDGIVITEKAIFVIEVKNPHMDIYIDERGNYLRVKDTTMHLDSNISEKMNDKIFILESKLKDAGIENPRIESIIVFTNSTIHVENRYEFIKTSFLGSVPHIIEKYDGSKIYNTEDMKRMSEIILESETKETFPVPLDIRQFKNDFAVAMAKIEYAAEHYDELKQENITEKIEITENDEKLVKEENENQENRNSRNNGISFKVSAFAAACFTAGVIAAKIFSNFKK